MPKRPGAKSDTRAAAGRILMVRPPGCTGQQPAAPARKRPDPRRWQHATPQPPGRGAPLLPGAVPAQRRPTKPVCDRQRRGWPGMGLHATRSLPTYAYLHQHSPHHTIVDSFFHAALRCSRRHAQAGPTVAYGCSGPPSALPQPRPEPADLRALTSAANPFAQALRIGDPAARRPWDRITLRDERWSRPIAQVSADMIGDLVADMAGQVAPNGSL